MELLIIDFVNYYAISIRFEFMYNLYIFSIVWSFNCTNVTFDSLYPLVYQNCFCIRLMLMFYVHDLFTFIMVAQYFWLRQSALIRSVFALFSNLVGFFQFKYYAAACLRRSASYLMKGKTISNSRNALCSSIPFVVLYVFMWHFFLLAIHQYICLISLGGSGIVSFTLTAVPW